MYVGDNSSNFAIERDTAHAFSNRLFINIKKTHPYKEH